MPHIKNALIRYRIIDKALRNQSRPFPKKKDLRLLCEEALYGDPDGNHICDSTIEKDMFAMREEHDAPIKYSRAEKGYYYADKDFSINEIPLSDDDVSSIQFALSTLSQFKDTEMFQQFGFALNKIVDRVNTNPSKSEDRLEQVVQFEAGNTTTGNEYLSPLLAAIKEYKVVYFDYESFISQQRKRRMVTPLLLKEYQNRWYLISFDLVKEAIITYALDRMEELDVTDDQGRVPDKFNADLFFKYSIGITASNDARPEEIIFEADNVASRYISSQPFHESQKMISNRGKETRFSLFVIISEELIRKLMSYSGELKVLKPDSLSEELQKRASDTLRRYKRVK